ncbi:MAG: hypothetical protein ACOC0A_00380, partial [Planctomycetota bacterium]
MTESVAEEQSPNIQFRHPEKAFPELPGIGGKNRGWTSIPFLALKFQCAVERHRTSAGSREA